MRKLISLVLISFAATTLLAQTNWPSVTNYLSSAQAIVQVFPDGHYIAPTGQKVMPASSTCGIQEAINSLPSSTNMNMPGGGRVLFAPGIYYISNTINAIPPTTTGTNRSPGSLMLEGGGATASIILFTNTSAGTNNVLYSEGSGFLVMRDLMIATTHDNTNAMILSKISNLDMQNCMIGKWSEISNNPAWGLSPTIYPNFNITNNLIGIHLEGPGPCMIRSCTFVGLSSGIWINSDHVEVEYCSFFVLGRLNQTVQTNYWPTSSPHWLGGGIILGNCNVALHPDYGGNNIYNFFGNHFYWTEPWYSIGDINTTGARCSYNDSRENAAHAGLPAIVSNGAKFTVINPQYAPPSTLKFCKTLGYNQYDNWNNDAGSLISYIDIPNQLSTNYSAFNSLATNVVGTVVKAQIPIVVSNITYYIDLKQ